MTRLLAAIAAVGLLAWAVGQPSRADDKKSDKDKMQGEWVMTKGEQGGQELPEELATSGSWTVKGTKYTFKIGGSDEDGTFTLTTDSKPTGIELNIKSGNDEGKKQGGIYKFQGETLVFCFARPGETDKPKKFSTTEGGGFFMITLKKGKKDK